MRELIDDDSDFHASFSCEIMEVLIPLKLQLPKFTPYDSTTNPVDHMHSFECNLIFH